jgi:peptidoglycan/LPS O-acetylase OafA/YrhL
MNGLRGVAALAIVAYHWSFRELLNLDHGFLAVDLFFMLSGFVIAHSYEDRLRAGLTCARFLSLRLIRLYPLYLFGTALSILGIFSSFLINGRVIDSRVNEVHAIPFAILMIPCPPLISDWAGGFLYPLDVPAWSLFFEVLVNILYGASVRFWNVKRLCLLLSLVAPALFLQLSLAEGFAGGGGFDWSSIHIGFLRVLFSFPAGVLIYKLHRNIVFLRKTPSIIIVGFLPLLLILPSSYAIPFNVMVSFPALVILASISDEPQGIIAYLFKNLGAASYAVYAIHEPLHGILYPTVYTLFRKIGVPPMQFPTDLLLIVIIVPCSLLFNQIYDNPFRSLLTKYFLKLTTAAERRQFG